MVRTDFSRQQPLLPPFHKSSGTTMNGANKSKMAPYRPHKSLGHSDLPGLSLDPISQFSPKSRQKISKLTEKIYGWRQKIADIRKDGITDAERARIKALEEKIDKKYMRVMYLKGYINSNA